MAKEVSKDMTKEMNKKVDEEFPIKRFPPVSQGGPGRNRKPPFGALVTLIINTIVLSIVIIMSTAVLFPDCCRVALIITATPYLWPVFPLITATSAVPEMVPGNWLFSSHIQSLTMPLPVSPPWFLQTWKPSKTGDYRRGRRIIIEAGNDGRWLV